MVGPRLLLRRARYSWCMSWRRDVGTAVVQSDGGTCVAAGVAGFGVVVVVGVVGSGVAVSVVVGVVFGVVGVGVSMVGVALVPAVVLFVSSASPVVSALASASLMDMGLKEGADADSAGPAFVMVVVFVVVVGVVVGVNAVKNFAVDSCAANLR